jgi:hypothetical protein
MFLAFLMAAVLALPQTIDITPQLIQIPADKVSAGTWPDWDMNNVGYTTYTITYNTGSTGFLANGFIEVGFGYQLKDDGVTNNPHYTDNLDYIMIPNDGARASPVDQFQIATPNAANYTTVSAPVNTTLSLAHNAHPAERVLKILFNTALPANSTITITFGDTSQGGPGAIIPWNAGRPRLVVFEKRNPNTAMIVSPVTFPIVLFTGKSATAFVVNAPLVVEVEKPFEFIVQAVQGRDVNPDAGMTPVEDFSGTIEWACPEATLIGTQTQRTYQRSDHGIKRFTGIFHYLGFYTIAINADGGNLLLDAPSTLSLSNHIKVVPPGYSDRIYTGDLQRHSCEGGHAAIPDWLCWRELRNLGDDFGTVVEHSELFFSGWRHANKIAQDAQALYPNFVVFPGYEYGLPGAHRHVIFKTFTTDPSLAASASNSAELPLPIVAPTITDFLNNLHNPPTASIPRIAIIHHSLWDKPNFPNVPFEWGPNLDDSVQRLVEIYSTHGSSEVNHTGSAPFEYPIAHDIANERPASEAASVRAALRMGYKFGIIGGTDRHGYYRSQSAGDDGAGPYTRAGLGFVHGFLTTPDLRDRIWEGLDSRHTYATTGSRMYLNFTVLDTFTGMGDFYSADNPPVFHIEAASAGLALSYKPKITDVWIFRDGDTMVAYFGYETGHTLVNQNWMDNNPILDNQYHSYYVKILQDDGQTAWSSPIWASIGPVGH